MAHSIPSEFSFSAFIQSGWQLFRDNWQYLLKVALVLFLVSAATSALNGKGDNAVLSLISALIQLLVNLAAMKIVLELTNGKKLPLTIDTFVSQKDLIFPYLIAVFLLGLRVMLGYILLIIPGIIWTIQFQFVPLLIIDKKVKPQEAFLMSTALTNGRKLTLLGYAILFALFNLAGLLFFVVGILFTAPITYLAYASMYRYLQKNS